MSSIPPKTFKRNEYGLLEDPPIPYVYNEDGSVNWRKMIRSEFLVANKQRTQETDITKLEDKDLLILIGGIKELAQIRGFTCVSYDVPEAGPSYVIASCYINWIANYETNDQQVSFQSLADASPDNTQSFARNYLAAIAENRAFVRCVRNFLKINIVGQDPVSPTAVLSNLMKEKGVTLDQIKKRLIKDGFAADAITSINEIPKPKIFELIERIKKAP